MIASTPTPEGVVVGALVFPCGFILVVLLGLELVTGNLAILPISALARRTAVPRMLVTWLLVWGFNFIGALLYAALFFAVVGRRPPGRSSEGCRPHHPPPPHQEPVNPSHRCGGGWLDQRFRCRHLGGYPHRLGWKVFLHLTLRRRRESTSDS